jgi:hypothetical protein
MPRPCSDSIRTARMVGCVLVVALGGCSKRAPSAPPPAASDVTAAAPSSATPTAPAHGLGRARIAPTPVWLDGAHAATLSFGELPEGLERVRRSVWHDQADHVRLDRYLAAIGASPSRIRAVHLYGMRGRVSIIEGDELRRHGDKLLVGFTQGDRGKPQTGFSSSFLRHAQKVDIITAVAIYIDKPAPVRAEDGNLKLDGRVLGEGELPYVAAAPKGTRLYVGGRIAGRFQRRVAKALGPDAPAEDAARNVPLLRYLATAGVDLSRAVAIDLVANDDLVLRLDAPRAGQSEPSSTPTFDVPPHAHGKIAVHLPDQARTVGIDAVLVHTRAPSPRSALPADSLRSDDDGLTPEDG